MPTLKIALTTEYIELNQLLKLAGLAASGGAGKVMVAAGGILVDGAEELRKTCKIRAGQVVKAGDTRIRVVAAAPPAEASAPTAKGSVGARR
jgi:ribosome-associated protein